MSSDGQPSTPVDLGSLSGEQWIICIAAGAVFVAIVIGNFVLRNARRWRALSDIRLNIVPPGFRTLQDLPHSVRNAIIAEAEREKEVRVVPPWQNDCGWGSPSGEYAGIHFKRAVAKSITMLEERAVRRDKRLSLSNFWRVLEDQDVCGPPNGKEWAGGDEGRERVLRARAFDIRSYMGLLALEVPGLDARQASEYASFFERSHTPGVEFTEREYSIFVGVLLGVIRCLEKSTL